jgi:hypothetical protein
LPDPYFFGGFIPLPAECEKKALNIRKQIRELLHELSEDKVRLYTSILTVQELAVAAYRTGMAAKDTYGDISSVARVYTLTKDVALTAAKHEAELKDLAEKQTAKRSRKKPETEDEKRERICENRRRKWGLFSHCHCPIGRMFRALHH